MAIKPEDMLPDNQDFATANGQRIRKGSMAAAIANATLIDSPDATPAEKQAALDAIRELVPALKAFGLTQVVTWKNPDIQALFEETEK